MGCTSEAADVLAAWFLAVELAMSDGHWQAAQHLELAAPEWFGAVAPDVLTLNSSLGVLQEELYPRQESEIPLPHHWGMFEDIVHPCSSLNSLQGVI